jgi:phospholipase/carboxylesterase
MSTREEQIELAGRPTVAVGAPDAPMLIVMCHGFAMTPADLSPFAHSLGVAARWLFPEGPAPAALVPGEPRGRAWWNIDPVRRLEAIAVGPRDFAPLEPPDLPAARALLGAILDEVLATAAGRPVILGGFSSGGMLAFDTQLRAPRPVRGLALLSATRLCWREQAAYVARAPCRRWSRTATPTTISRSPRVRRCATRPSRPAPT